MRVGSAGRRGEDSTRFARERTLTSVRCCAAAVIELISRGGADVGGAAADAASPLVTAAPLRSVRLPREVTRAA